MSVRLDLKPLKEFLSIVSGDLRQSSNGPIRKAIGQWAVRYRSFVRERFDRFSKGGGDWRALASSTVAGRRKGKPSRGVKGVKLSRATILRDTGTLFAALNPVFTRKPGSIQQDIPFGVRVGFGGPAKYPGGSVTIADIAGFHQEGEGRLPKRMIIVSPSSSVSDAMAGDMERAMGRATT